MEVLTFKILFFLGGGPYFKVQTRSLNRKCQFGFFFLMTGKINNLELSNLLEFRFLVLLKTKQYFFSMAMKDEKKLSEKNHFST